MSSYTDIDGRYISWVESGRYYIGMIDGVSIEVDFRVNKLEYHCNNLYAVGNSVVAKYKACSLSLIWKRNIGGVGLAVDDGVYVIGDSLNKLSLNGEPLWNIPLSGTWVDAKCNRVYVAGNDRVYTLNKHGNIIGASDVPGVTHVIYGDRLYWAGTFDGKVFVGSKKWRVEGEAVNVTGIEWNRGVFITGRLNGMGEFDKTVIGDVYLALARGGCWIKSAGGLNQGGNGSDGDIGEQIVVTSNTDVAIPLGATGAHIIAIGAGGEGGSRGAIIEGDIVLSSSDTLNVEVDQGDVGSGGSAGEGGSGGRGEGDGSDGVDGTNGNQGGNGGMASIVTLNGGVVLVAGGGGGNSYNYDGTQVIGGDAGQDGNGEYPGLSNGNGGGNATPPIYGQEGTTGTIENPNGGDGQDGQFGGDGGEGGDAYIREFTERFEYTGEEVTYNVPSSARNIKLTVKGANGGPNGAGTSADGASIVCDADNLIGKTIHIRIGQNGIIESSDRTFNGGGGGGTGGPVTGSSGGGASSIHIVDSGNIPIIVAGGGGAFGGGGIGGNGGSPNGQDGTSTCPGEGGDNNGTGGNGGCDAGDGGNTGEDGGNGNIIGVGVGGQPGDGGIGLTNVVGGGGGGNVSADIENEPVTGGGGGGGGYSGGGGGGMIIEGSQVTLGGGGGGGSSYTNNLYTTNVVYNTSNDNPYIALSYNVTGEGGVGGDGGDGVGATNGFDSNSVIGGDGTDGGIPIIPETQCGIPNLESDFTWNGTNIVKYNGTRTDVVIPTTHNNLPVSIIEIAAFKSSNITSVCGLSILEIHNEAFEDCASLESINFPNLITLGVVSSFDGGAFQNCTSLDSVSLPNAITIENNAFSECSNLSYLSLPNVEYIGTFAFDLCISLTSITLPNAVTIRDGVFSRCSSLINITLPNATSLGLWAFIDCTDLTTLYLPSSAPTLGLFAFDGTTSFSTIHIPCGETATGYTAANNWPTGFTISNRRLVIFDMNGVGEQIPDQYLDCATGVVSQPSNPSHSDYEFEGWYADELLTLPFVFGTTLSDDPIIVYLGWEEKVTWLQEANNLYIAPGNVDSIINQPSYMSHSGYMVVGSPNTTSIDNVTVITNNVSRFVEFTVLLNRGGGRGGDGGWPNGDAGDGGNGANGGGGGGNGFPNGGGGGGFNSSGAGGLSFLNGAIIPTPPITDESQRVVIQFFGPTQRPNRVTYCCRPIVATTNNNSKYLWKPN